MNWAATMRRIPQKIRGVDDPSNLPNGAYLLMNTKIEVNTQAASPFEYEGPTDLRQSIVAALTRVVDPEVALSIVDVGLIYGVSVTADKALVRMTMTSSACPVTEVIIGDVEDELDRVLPNSCAIEVELCWEPAWTPARMSKRARHFMGW